MSNQLNPFSPDQQLQLARLLGSATPDQLFWLSGYLTGLSQSKITVPQVLQNTNAKILTILYGTHTGHSEDVAHQLEEKAKSKGIPVRLSSLDDYKVRDLNKVENLALIVSTHGEGEPPLMAEDLHEYAKGGKAKLNKLHFTVLALGDHSYKFFCQTGVDFADSFKKYGGIELLPIVKCDVDYEADAAKWINTVISKLEIAENTIAIQTPQANTPPQKVKYSKSNPFYADVLDKRKITGRNSGKEVWHVELSLENSGLKFEPGDSLGIFSNNPPELVQKIIDFTGFSPNSTITTKYDDVTLYEALYHHFEITVLNRKVLEDYASMTSSIELKQLIQDEQKLEDYLYGHDLLDLLQDYPSKITPHQLVSLLRYLPSRLYSISSSLNANPNEVHITIAKVDFENKNRKRKGACSTYISERLMENEKIPVYVEKNINFRLPKDTNAPVIMIGAGTGVAPFRSFLQEFKENGKQQNSWLFFGDRTFNEDFLYQVEWQKYLQNGILEKIDVAFSRDQKEKIYVQHKLQENATELFRWLENGAHLYICGDRKKMFHDVQKTLVEIISSQGGLSLSKAEEYLHQLKKLKRYQLDVY